MADELNEASARRRRKRQRQAGRDFAKPAALAVFAVLVTMGPLAFGSVDRVVQITLTALLGVGMLIVPPRIIGLPSWLNRVVIALVGILVLKEFAPASWFGAMSWRTTLEQAYANNVTALAAQKALAESVAFEGKTGFMPTQE